jgi:hypothetical protein
MAVEDSKTIFNHAELLVHKKDCCGSPVLSISNGFRSLYQEMPFLTVGKFTQRTYFFDT